MPRSESAWVYYVRVLAFLLHFGSAIFISMVAVKCGGSFIYNSGLARRRWRRGAHLRGKITLHMAPDKNPKQ